MTILAAPPKPADEDIRIRRQAGLKVMPKAGLLSTTGMVHAGVATTLFVG